jgi:hypothetical protein
LLQEIYDLKTLRDERNRRLSQALTEVTGGDFTNTFFDACSDEMLELVLKNLLGEDLYGDWEYLLYECASMTGGGTISVDGKDYRIQTVDDLWDYWGSKVSNE